MLYEIFMVILFILRVYFSKSHSVCCFNLIHLAVSVHQWQKLLLLDLLERFWCCFGCCCCRDVLGSISSQVGHSLAGLIFVCTLPPDSKKRRSLWTNDKNTSLQNHSRIWPKVCLSKCRFWLVPFWKIDTFLLFLFNKALVKSTFQVTIWSDLLCLLRRRALRYRLSSQPGRRWGWFAGSELHPVLQQAQLERQAHAGYKVVIKGINGEQILFPVMELGQVDNGLVIIYPLVRVTGITVDMGNWKNLVLTWSVYSKEWVGPVKMKTVEDEGSPSPFQARCSSSDYNRNLAQGLVVDSCHMENEYRYSVWTGIPPRTSLSSLSDFFLTFWFKHCGDDKCFI